MNYKLYKSNESKLIIENLEKKNARIIEYVLHNFVISINQKLCFFLYEHSSPTIYVMQRYYGKTPLNAGDTLQALNETTTTKQARQLNTYI